MNRYLHLPALNEHKSAFCEPGGKRLECFLREFSSHRSVMKAYWMGKWIKQIILTGFGMIEWQVSNGRGSEYGVLKGT